jgi:hypothetical protein
MNYFNKIPTINYNGYTVKNLLARAKISDKTKANKLAFYPYTMKETERADILSNDYYDSPGYTWLIWLANDIVDPYYDMPMDENDFYRFIETKYGSYQTAARKVKYYRMKYDNEERLTIAEFNGLNSSLKKYYDPVVDNNYGVQRYKRKQDDHIAQTNKVVQLTFTAEITPFTVGEEIRVNSDNYAFVTFSNATVTTCHHVTGAFSEGNTVTGQESNVSATVSTATILSETLASTDAAYWEPVTFLDYEQELNEMKKEIQLLDVRYRGQAELELKRTMGAK